MTGNVVLDDFDDLTAAGQEHGVSFVATPEGYGLAFSETTESRIVYPYASGFPRAGTLEMTVNVDYGYNYSGGIFQTSEQHALLFTTDIQSGDVTWPGSAWLYGFADGRMLFHIAGEMYLDGWAPEYRLWVDESDFRFDSWHTVGITYGPAGMAIAVDGSVVGTLPTNTQLLAGGGTESASLGQPTIGESVPSVWSNNEYEGGFNGVVEAIRYSDTQFDWALGAPPPTPPSLSISDATVTEGGTLQFTVTRSGSTAQAVSAYFQVFDGTADGALSEDYTTAGGYLTITAGETTAMIEIATSHDEIVEGDETVVVRLSDPTTAITDGEAVGTIVDNDQLLSTAELFAEYGKLVTLATLANAAYHLHEDEVVWTGYNDAAPAADALYDSLATELQLLDADDLPDLAPLLTADTFFPIEGLVDGIYTASNGAALLARSTDALFVSFRGTNDFSAIGLFPTLGTTDVSPDIEDWNNKGRHYGYFAEMVEALHGYVVDHPEIQVVYVTGHSLGGGMVQPFVSEAADWGVAVDATTFASPGFNDDLWPFDESSTLISNVWNVHDPIQLPAWASEIQGGQNVIENGVSLLSAMPHHSMDLYLAEIRFLHEELPELTSRELVLNGIDYSRILMHVVEVQGGQFLPGIAADELTGSNDDEIVLGGAGSDVINAGGGNDLVLAGAGDDLVSARDDSVNSVSSLVADDVFDGGADIDTFDLSALFYPGDPGYTVSLDPTTGHAAGLLIGHDSLRNFENVIATRYNDHVTGNDVENRLEGLDGADTLIGLGGSDVLIGGKGDDRLEGGSESDTYFYLEDADTILEAGGSADVIQFDPTSGSVLRANVSFTANSSHDLIITVDRTFSIDINKTVTILDFFRGGSRVVESLTFTDGSTFDLTGDIDFEGSWLFGTAGDNQLTGVGSTDTVSYDASIAGIRIDLDSSNLSPLKPASRILAFAGDSLVGYAMGVDIGTDTLVGVENAVGGLGDDVIIGSRFSNVLDGGTGRDLLIGEGSKDFLIGGAGADDFVYFAVLDSRKGRARDVIEDFQRRADDIDLSALDANLDRAGNQAFKWIGSKAFTGKAGELHYVKKAGYILVEGDIDGNGKADFQIQVDDIAAIGKGDFIF